MSHWKTWPTAVSRVCTLDVMRRHSTQFEDLKGLTWSQAFFPLYLSPKPKNILGLGHCHLIGQSIFFSDHVPWNESRWLPTAHCTIPYVLITRFWCANEGSNMDAGERKSSPALGGSTCASQRPCWILRWCTRTGPENCWSIFLLVDFLLVDLFTGRSFYWSIFDLFTAVMDTIFGITNQMAQWLFSVHLIVDAMIDDICIYRHC